MRGWIVSAALGLLVSACGETGSDSAAPPETSAASVAETTPVVAPAALEGFTHVAGEDLFGYYLPTQPVQIGDYRLDTIHIGGEMEFAAWERGERTETYAPVMLEFSDVTSPLMRNELGQDYHAKTFRVLPSAYRLGEGDFRFLGRHPEIGDVQIDGTLDLAQLALERSSGGLSQAEAAAVLQTSAQIGPEAFRSLSFVWFGGD